MRSMPDQGCNVAIPVSEDLICAGRGACGSIGIKEDYRESSGIPLLKRNKNCIAISRSPQGFFHGGFVVAFSQCGSLLFGKIVGGALDIFML